MKVTKVPRYNNKGCYWEEGKIKIIEPTRDNMKSLYRLVILAIILGFISIIISLCVDY